MVISAFTPRPLGALAFRASSLDSAPVLFVAYGVWFLGLLLLLLDAGGHFRTSEPVARVSKLVGLAALSIPAVVPLLAVYGRWWEWSGWIFPAVAHAYSALAALFVAGVIVGRRNVGRRLARLAYIGLLALAAVPSFVLLPIAGPTVGLSGLAFARYDSIA
jgi:hypothetical protein